MNFYETKCLISVKFENISQKRFLCNFANILQDRLFVVGCRKNSKLLLDSSFDRDFQNIVWSSLLVFLVLVIKLI